MSTRQRTNNILTIGALFLILFVFANTTFAEDQLYVNISKQDERITLASGDAVFTVKAAKQTLITVSGCRTALLTIQNKTDNFSMRPERLKEAKMVADDSEHKIVKAVFSLIDSTKDIGKECKDCELELLLEIKKDIPCLFLTSRIRNIGTSSFACYSSWGWFYGKDYTTPDLNVNSWKGKYGTLPAVEWLYLSSLPKVGQMTGYGIITSETLQQTPFTSLLIMPTPSTQTIGPEDEIKMQMILLPAKSAKEVESIYQKVQPYLKKKEIDVKMNKKEDYVLATGKPGPDSVYYKPRKQFIGYPALSLSDEERPLPKTGADGKYNLRMTRISYGNVTKEEAEKIARQAKERGFNIILAERNRYLFKEPEDKLGTSGNHFLTLDEIIRNAKIMVDACHKYGIKFFLHTTCTMVTKEYIDKHPDYASIDIKTGKPIHNEYGTYCTCIANKDFQKDFLKRLERLIKETGADGLMQDEIAFWSYSAVCPSCRRRFKEETEYSLPEKYNAFFSDSKNPATIRWQKWRGEKVLEVNLAVKSILGKYGATRITYRSHNTLPNTYFRSGSRFSESLKWADIIGYECEPPGFRNGYLYLWPYIICEMKNLRGISDHTDSAPWTLFYPTTYGDYTWGWLIAMSQGCRLWWISEDDNATKCWQPLINWEQKYEDILMKTRPYANIGILFSLDTSLYNPKRNTHEWIYGFTGLCTALTDSHIPYRIIIDEDMDIKRLKELDLKTVMLLNTGNLSDKAVKAIREFVNAGGTLIASGDASLYDNQGNQRKDFGLAELFGVSYLSETNSRENILSIPKENELTGKFIGTFEHNEPFDLVKVKNGKVIGEMVKENGRKYPGIILNNYGKGKVVYFAGHPELKYFYTSYYRNLIEPGTYWEDNRDEKFGKILKQCAIYNNKDIPFIAENLPSGVVVEAYRQKYGDLEGIQVHLANFLGGRLKQGIVPTTTDVNFPDVGKHLPSTDKPISISVRAENMKKVYLISPDFDETVEMPFIKQGEYIKVELPILYRYAILYFSQGKDERILKITKGKIVNKIPEAKKLQIIEKVPLVGKYDPNNIVIFADSEKIIGGKYTGPSKGELSRIIYGTESEIPEIKTTFILKKKVKKVTLEIGARDDNISTKAPLEILINDKIVFQGRSTYPDNEWGVRQFEVNSEYIKVGENSIIIKNTGEGKKMWPPWQGINFIKVIPEYE
ncbi:beta-galactosidase trimerization domain-containing protein [bacterium]|nr:beta-galactosidase trimerization domain-containing protein [bacterium]